jgi:hypothetical protein
MSAFRALVLEVHKTLQDTEAYAAYAAKVVRRYRRNDLMAKWTVAAAACAPFMAKLQSSSASTASWFSALVPLLAIGLPFLNFSRMIQLASELHGKHAEILPPLRKIWREMSVADEYAPNTEKLTEQWRKEIHDIDLRLAAIRAKKSDMPEIRSLSDEAIRDCDKIQPITFQDPPKQSISSSVAVSQSGEEKVEDPAPKNKLKSKKTKVESKPQPEKKESTAASSYSAGPTVINYNTKIDL